MQRSVSTKRIILIEYNELCMPLLREWMNEGLLPNFKSFYDASVVFETQSDAIDEPTLNPWVQWYSMHSGLPYRTHGVYQLTDGPTKSFTDIWSELIRAGKRVANFSSMNAKRFSAAESIFIPDPWCGTQKASPSALDDYYEFVAQQVREYTNTSRQSQIGDMLRFVRFLLSHGLRMRTVANIAKQLVLELCDRKEGWRRAVLLDQMQFDVFRYFWKKSGFDFSTFFTNSTAHFQHCYWRYMQPEAFAVKPTADDIRRYGNAIRFGYECMDRQLGDFLSLDDGQTLFILATALSQEPQLEYQDVGGWHFYRPYNAVALLQDLGIRYDRLQSIMAQQYVLDFSSPADTEIASARLRSLTCDGQPLFHIIDKGPLIPSPVKPDSRGIPMAPLM